MGNELALGSGVDESRFVGDNSGEDVGEAEGNGKLDGLGLGDGLGEGKVIGTGEGVGVSIQGG